MSALQGEAETSGNPTTGGRTVTVDDDTQEDLVRSLSSEEAQISKKCIDEWNRVLDSAIAVLSTSLSNTILSVGCPDDIRVFLCCVLPEETIPADPTVRQ